MGKIGRGQKEAPIGISKRLEVVSMFHFFYFSANGDRVIGYDREQHQMHHPLQAVPPPK